MKNLEIRMDAIKVNLGCGKDAVEGWINIDNSLKVLLAKYPFLKWILFKVGIISEEVYKEKWSKNIKRHDVRKGLPFDNNSVDCIYCSHLLEHLTQEEAKKLCQEAFRVLKPNAISRVVVPDLKLMAQKYIDGDLAFFKDQTGPVADRFMSANMFHDFHKWAYDSKSLKFLLEEAGFDNNKIFERDYRKGNCPDLEKIEHKKESVYAEAIK